MSGFGGNTTHPMDAKGRVSLASKYRRKLPDDLVIVRSADTDFPSLSLFAADEHDAWIDSIFESKGGFQRNSKSHQALMRRLHGGREEIVVDQATGRMLIPVNLREYASLEKSVVVVGVGDHIEIWNPDILAKADEAYAEVELLDLP